jgi:hypothetical protein
MKARVARRRAAVWGAAAGLLAALVMLATYGWRTSAFHDVTLELSVALPAELRGTTMEIAGGNAAQITAVSGQGPWIVHARISGLMRHRLTFQGIEQTLLVSRQSVKEAVAKAAGVPVSAVVRLNDGEILE